MKQGKYSNGSRRKLRKPFIVLVSCVLLLGLVIGGTAALLIDKSENVVNKFNPSQVTTYVEETRDGSIKKNVMIKNTGDTTAYIRAAVVVTWQNADGDVYGQVPVLGTDYTIVYKTTTEPGANKWIKAADGFYYYTSPVKSVVEDKDHCTTDILITSCSPVDGRAPEGYYLNVEILGSGIQYVPTSVVTEQWASGVREIDADGTTLVIKQ